MADTSAGLSGLDSAVASMLVRHRFHLVTVLAGAERALLAEDCSVVAFTGPAGEPIWLPAEAVGPLLDTAAEGNVSPEAAREFLAEVLAAPAWRPHLDVDARQRAAELLEAHERVLFVWVV